MSRDWSSRFLKSHHVVTWTVLHTPVHTSSGGHRWPPQALRIAPPSLNAPVRLRRGRFLPPLFLSPGRMRTRSLSNQAARTPRRVRPDLPGTRARASLPREAAVACLPAGRAGPRAIGPTHLRRRRRRRRPGPAAGPGAEATLAGRAAARGRLPWRVRGWRRRPRSGEGRRQGPQRSRRRRRRPERQQAPLEAAFGPRERGEARQAQLTQRRGVRSGRHGAPGDRHQRFLVLGGGFSFANLPGGRGPDDAAEERGEPVLSRGGRRRRQTHKEGGERMRRGRAGGGGTGAWIGPARGEVGVGGLRLVER